MCCACALCTGRQSRGELNLELRPSSEMARRRQRGDSDDGEEKADPPSMSDLVITMESAQRSSAAALEARGADRVGFLLKKGYRFFNLCSCCCGPVWKKRYFIIKGGFLFRFSSPRVRLRCGRCGGPAVVVRSMVPSGKRRAVAAATGNARTLTSRHPLPSRQIFTHTLHPATYPPTHMHTPNTHTHTHHNLLASHAPHLRLPHALPCLSSRRAPKGRPSLSRACGRCEGATTTRRTTRTGVSAW